MRTLIRTAAVVAVVALGAVFVACGSSPTSPTTSSLVVTGTVPAVGQTSQLTAKVTLSNGTTQDVTTQATWSSSDTAVATVTSGGLLKTLQLGTADITAAYQNLTGKLSLSLRVTSLTLSGTSSLTGLGQTGQLIATASLANGSKLDITQSKDLSWQSSNTMVVTTSSNGTVASVGYGVANVTATYLKLLSDGSADSAQTSLSVSVSPSTESSTACVYEMFLNGADLGGYVPGVTSDFGQTGLQSSAGFSFTIGLIVRQGTNCSWRVYSGIAFATPWVSAGLVGGNGSVVQPGILQVNGTGTVRVSASPNPGQARLAHVALDNHTDIEVPQAGSVPCAFALTPTSVSLSSAGGTVDVLVTTGDGCYWFADSSDSWMRVTPSLGRLGNGQVHYTIDPNTSKTSRIGQLLFKTTEYTDGSPLGQVVSSVVVTQAGG